MVKKMENMALIPPPISLIKLLVKAQHQGGIPYLFRNYLETTVFDIVQYWNDFVHMKQLLSSKMCCQLDIRKR